MQPSFAQPNPLDTTTSLMTSGSFAADRSNPRAVRSDLTNRQQSFSSVIARHTSDANQSAEQAARSSAEQFVAISFVQPLLKELREASDAPPPFGPSKGEKQFRALLDAETAQQIASASHFPLVDRLARDLLQASPAAHEPAQQPRTEA